MDWQITVGNYRVAMVDSIEIHKSVDLLADTAKVVLPGSAYNKAFRIEQQIRRGDRINIKLGYNSDLVSEFDGYLLSIDSDDGSLTFNCEDDLFLLRKAVPDKEFKNVTIKTVADYLISSIGVKLKVVCTLSIDYEKFVISKATGYDVLKKIQEETKGNIYLKNGELHIHPPYIEKSGNVDYSFQHNIESSDLKYVRKEDKNIEVIVKSTGKDGKKKEVRFGTTGGDQTVVDGYGLTEASMKKRAEIEFNLRLFDGYEGSITSWLIPYVEPAYSAKIVDEDYEYKDGIYYVNSVTTAFDANGGSRKVEMGKKLGDLNNG